MFAGVFVCIDSTLLIDKLDSGIYWKIFDKLRSKNKNSIFSSVRFHIRTVRSSRDCGNDERSRPKRAAFSFPEIRKREKSFDEVIYYPETKHLVVIETKSGFIPTPAKYGRSIREFTKQVRRKFVEKEDGIEKGVKQLAKHLSRILSKERTLRHKLADSQLQHCFDEVEKVSPLLIVQERVLSIHIHEQALNTELHRYLLQKDFY